MLLNEVLKEKKSGMSRSRFHFRFYQFRGLSHIDVMKFVQHAEPRREDGPLGGVKDWVRRVKDGLSQISAPHSDKEEFWCSFQTSVKHFPSAGDDEEISIMLPISTSL